MVRPLRNAQVISNLNLGGAQKLLCVLAEHQSHGNLDTRVAVLDPPAETPYAEELKAAGVPVTYFAKPGQSMVSRVTELARWFRQEQISVAHAHMQRANIAAGLAGAIARVPVCAGLHTPDVVTTGQSKARRRLETFVIRRCATKAIACSPATAESHRDRLAPLKIDVATNPVPLPNPSAPRPADTHDGMTKFLVVGRLAPEKAVDVVLDAADDLRKRGTQFQITIAGDGAARNDLEAKCRAMALNDHVRFLGLVKDMAPLYQAHHVYLSASRAEGLSIALLEAMAQGLPAIATAAGDAGTLVNSDTGFCLARSDAQELAAAMSAITALPDKGYVLGQSGRKKVLEEFSPQSWVATLAKLYGEACRQRTV